MTRRCTVIALVGTLGTLSIAGCSGSGEGNTETRDSTGDADSGMGPEKTAEHYYTAMIEGDIETINDLLHPKSELYPAEEGDFEAGNVTLVNTEELSVSEYVERDSSVENEEEALDNIDQTLAETGADSLAIVWVTYRENGESHEGPLYLAKVDSGFKIVL